MAVNTSGTILKYHNGTAFVKLVDIKSYPDMGATPSKLDTTTLTQTKYKTSILGLQDLPDLTFEANYDETALALIGTLNGVKQFQLEFGDAGANGMFSWSGEIVAFATGGAVDEVRNMSIVCSATTELVFTP